jgi:hypothetical protein
MALRHLCSFLKTEGTGVKSHSGKKDRFVTIIRKPFRMIPYPFKTVCGLLLFLLPFKRVEQL